MGWEQIHNKGARTASEHTEHLASLLSIVGVYTARARSPARAVCCACFFVMGVAHVELVLY